MVQPGKALCKGPNRAIWLTEAFQEKVETWKNKDMHFALNIIKSQKYWPEEF